MDVRQDTSGQTRTNANVRDDVRGDIHRTIRTLEIAVDSLREQLTIANARTDRVERQLVDQLRTALADARAAERISSDVAAALRNQLDLLRAWHPWWRRWFR